MLLKALSIDAFLFSPGDTRTLPFVASVVPFGGGAQSRRDEKRAREALCGDEAVSPLASLSVLRDAHVPGLGADARVGVDDIMFGKKDTHEGYSSNDAAFKRLANVAAYMRSAISLKTGAA